MLADDASPYGLAELQALAMHCSRQENAARKVERRVRKSEAALLLDSRVGQLFDAIVTGRTDTNTWCRTLTPPVEGKLDPGNRLVDVGSKVRVKLVSTDVERGFIDFALAQ